MYWNLHVELNEQYFHAIHSRFTILPYVDKQHFEEKRFFAEETTYLLATYLWLCPMRNNALKTKKRFFTSYHHLEFYHVTT